MSTVVFRNAELLIGGVALQAALHQLSVDLSAEMLDETTFGDDTRVFRGGLLVGSISGAGYFDGVVGTEAVLWPQTGTDDVIFVAFPDGVTEGSLTTGRGYAMRGVLSEFEMGGQVGDLLDITFAAQSRGVEA